MGPNPPKDPQFASLRGKNIDGKTRGVIEDLGNVLVVKDGPVDLIIIDDIHLLCHVFLGLRHLRGCDNHLIKIKLILLLGYTEREKLIIMIPIASMNFKVTVPILLRVSILSSVEEIKLK